MRWAGDVTYWPAVAVPSHRPDVDPDRIGGFGFSIGGEMLIEAAAQSNGFRAIVSEGAGGRVGDEDMSGPARLLAEPNLAVMTAALTVFSNHGPPPPIVDRIGRIAPGAVFLIYADPGLGGENTRQPKYYAAAGEAEGDLEGAGLGTRRRNRCAAGRIRATCDRLLRSLVVTGRVSSRVSACWPTDGTVE